MGAFVSMFLFCFLLTMWHCECFGFDYKGVFLGEKTTLLQLEKIKGARCVKRKDGEIECRGFVTIADKKAFMLLSTNKYMETRSISFLPKSEDFDDIMSQFFLKFGKPNSIEKEEVQNAMGAKFTNFKIIWVDDKMNKIFAEKFSRKITESYISFHTKQDEEDTLRSLKKPSLDM